LEEDDPKYNLLADILTESGQNFDISTEILTEIGQNLTRVDLLLIFFGHRHFDRIFWSKGRSTHFFDRYSGQNFGQTYILTECQAVKIFCHNFLPSYQNEISTTAFPTEQFRSKRPNSVKILHTFGQNKLFVLSCIL